MSFLQVPVTTDYSSRSNVQNLTEKSRMVTPELAHQKRMVESGAGNRHVSGEPNMVNIMVAFDQLKFERF